MESLILRRKIIIVVDKFGEIDVKLWGEKINFFRVDIGLSIMMKGFKVDVYNGWYFLNIILIIIVEVIILKFKYFYNVFILNIKFDILKRLSIWKNIWV